MIFYDCLNGRGEKVMRERRSKRRCRNRGTILGGAGILIAIMALSCLSNFARAHYIAYEDFENPPNGWAQAKNGGSSFQSSSFGGFEYQMWSGSKVAYLKFTSGGADGQDYGNIWYYKNFSSIKRFNEISLYYVVSLAYHNSYMPQYEAMKAMLQFQIIYNNGETITYSYLLATWKGAGHGLNSWPNPGPRECLVYGGTPTVGVTAHPYLHPNSDFPNSPPNWNNVNYVRLYMWLYASGTYGDQFRIDFDNIALSD